MPLVDRHRLSDLRLDVHAVFSNRRNREHDDVVFGIRPGRGRVMNVIVVENVRAGLIVVATRLQDLEDDAGRRAVSTHSGSQMSEQLRMQLVELLFSNAIFIGQGFGLDAEGWVRVQEGSGALNEALQLR